MVLQRSRYAVIRMALKDYNMETSQEFEDQPLCNGRYYFDAKVTIYWREINSGIGSYEYWGSSANDSRITYEVDTYEVNEISIYDTDKEKYTIDNMENKIENYNNNKIWFDLVDSTVDDLVYDVEPPSYIPNDNYPEPDHDR